MIGDRLQTSGPVLIILGIVVAIFGLLPGGRFFAELPTLRGFVRKPLSPWSGRLWFIGGGAILIYLGVTQCHR
jgi:hypothetical protein